MSHPIRVVVVGLGATGIALAEWITSRNDLQLVGAVDTSADKAGKLLGDLVGGAPQIVVASALDDLLEADVAVLATSSWVDTVEPTITALVERSLNVVSICEELRDPTRTHPEAVARLDDLARNRGVSVLGTGCNPGMLMDTLPLLLSGLTLGVRSVHVERTADMSRYGAILNKFGLGLSPEEFEERRDAGTVMGHVGFAQSITALARGLGWDLDRIEIDPVTPAALAATEGRLEQMVISPGAVSVVRHQARGVLGGDVVIELVANFGLLDYSEGWSAADALRIEGVEQTISVTAPSGYESFLSTVAMAGNALAAVVEATPGFVTLSDLPVASLAGRGCAR
ncbi:dihydrodipicolinate reductase [Nocardioides aromaticivorans]|uniref:Dihydrodipicolinate reductase n=1 Tax=Nocardioides aromaticivorans TaxID=200618 RepID=A0ABX7PG26_9ACTN|nr:hypothetical protein [Nocardioides aromaticivorans]QSR24876.1 dihydrodipicolinate reductase [Nocardioides aromaticivorans]